MKEQKKSWCLTAKGWKIQSQMPILKMKKSKTKTKKIKRGKSSTQYKQIKKEKLWRKTKWTVENSMNSDEKLLNTWKERKKKKNERRLKHLRRKKSNKKIFQKEDEKCEKLLKTEFEDEDNITYQGMCYSGRSLKSNRKLMRRRQVDERLKKFYEMLN